MTAIHPLRSLAPQWHSSPMNFVIRTATVGDVPAMHRVRSAVRENRLSDPQRVTESAYLPYVTEGSAWLAESETGVMGFAILDPQTRTVWAMFVDPQAEGGGVGRALHQRMLEWASERGLERLSLSTAKGTRAETFYVAAGWLKTGLNEQGEVVFEISLTA